MKGGYENFAISRKFCGMLPKFRTAKFAYNFLESRGLNLMWSIDLLIYVKENFAITKFLQNFAKDKIKRNSAKFRRNFERRNPVSTLK
jgi:hypothetical protein